MYKVGQKVVLKKNMEVLCSGTVYAGSIGEVTRVRHGAYGGLTVKFVKPPFSAVLAFYWTVTYREAADTFEVLSDVS